MKQKNKSLCINAILNVIRQCCMILFPLITFPYASRILGAEYYGRVNFGTSIISYISLIAGLGITNYAIREGASKRNSPLFSQFINELFSLNFYSTIFSYLILFVLIVFWRKLAPYRTLLIIQSSIIFFTTIGLDWINIINEDYTYLTLRYILCQMIAVMFMFLFVRKKEDYLIYAFSGILGTILANITNIIHIRTKFKIRPEFVRINVVLKHLYSVIILFGNAIASLIYINSDITLLGLLSSDATVGYYSISVKIYTLVKQLINAMLLVAIPRVSKEFSLQNKSKVYFTLNNILKSLMLLIGPAVIGLLLLSRHIVIIIAGSSYLRSVSSLRILTIALLFATLACYYINVVMLPLKMEKKIFKATIVSASFNIIFNILLIPRFNEQAAAVTTLISEIIMAGFGFYYTHSFIKYNIKRTILLSMVGTILTGIICIISMCIFHKSIVIILSSFVCSTIAYLFLIVCCLKIFKWKPDKLFVN